MGLTAGAVRYRARRRGAALSERQWQGFREWGLIPEPGADGWDEAVVSRLVAVDALGATVRSLPRRVLLLDDPAYPRSPALTRRAMRRVIPTIRQPVRKLERMRRARQWWSEGPRRSSRSRSTQQLAAVLPPAQWPTLLDTVPDELFGGWSQSAYYFASALVSVTAGTDRDITDIPPEERHILVTVLDALSYREGNHPIGSA